MGVPSLVWSCHCTQGTVPGCQSAQSLRTRGRAGSLAARDRVGLDCRTVPCSMGMFGGWIATWFLAAWTVRVVAASSLQQGTVLSLCAQVVLPHGCLRQCCVATRSLQQGPHGLYCRLSERSLAARTHRQGAGLLGPLQQGLCEGLIRDRAKIGSPRRPLQQWAGECVFAQFPLDRVSQVFTTNCK